jgi:hypothetical protein
MNPDKKRSYKHIYTTIQTNLFFIQFQTIPLNYKQHHSKDTHDYHYKRPTIHTPMQPNAVACLIGSVEEQPETECQHQSIECSRCKKSTTTVHLTTHLTEECIFRAIMCDLCEQFIPYRKQDLIGSGAGMNWMGKIQPRGA